MYGHITNYASVEKNLIWARYAGFLVINGFILDGINSEEKILPISILIITGIILTNIWAIMNFSGWLTLDIFLLSAARIEFKTFKIPLPTTPREKKGLRKPHDLIYKLAQSIPLLFFIIYLILAELLLSKYGSSAFIKTIVIGVSIILPCSIFYFIKEKIYKKKCNDSGFNDDGSTKEKESR